MFKNPDYKKYKVIISLYILGFKVISSCGQGTLCSAWVKVVTVMSRVSTLPPVLTL